MVPILHLIFLSADLSTWPDYLPKLSFQEYPTGSLLWKMYSIFNNLAILALPHLLYSALIWEPLFFLKVLEKTL